MSDAKQMVLTRPFFDGKEMEYLQECLQSGWVTQGPFVSRFENLVALRHQTQFAVATTSCTAALHLATLALGLGPEDEVIVPALTWVTSAHCAEYVGAKAVFADVRAETFNLDPAAFEAAISSKTRAVVVVHLFGQAAELDTILRIAGRHSLQVIEDAACAIGTEYDGRPVGGWGHAGCFSFHPRKVITTGEGGMVTTNNEEIARKAAIFRNHGHNANAGPAPSAQKPYLMGHYDHLGFNLRLSDINAAVGVAQMAKLDHLLEERQKLAKRYRELLADIEEIALPHVPPRCGHTYQSFVVRVQKGGMTLRNRLMEHLATRNIQTRPGTHAAHRLEYYRNKYRIHPDQFPVAAACEDTTITLPLFPGMTEADQVRVAESLAEALANTSKAAA